MQKSVDDDATTNKHLKATNKNGINWNCCIPGNNNMGTQDMSYKRNI